MFLSLCHYTAVAMKVTAASKKARLGATEAAAVDKGEAIDRASNVVNLITDSEEEYEADEGAPPR